MAITQPFDKFYIDIVEMGLEVSILFISYIILGISIN